MSQERLREIDRLLRVVQDELSYVQSKESSSSIKSLP
jgi:hypothetical protein